MKQFKKLFALLLAAAMLFTAAACSKGPDVTGKYEAIKITGSDGFEYMINGEFVELEKGGKGIFNNGYDFNLKWELEGEVFTGTVSFLAIEEPLNGTLKNGVLTVKYGDYTYVMTRGGVSEAEAAAAAGTSEGGDTEEVDPLVGFYSICELIADDGTVLDEATLAMLGETMATLDLKADNTVILSLSGEEPEEGKWKSGSGVFNFSGEKINYTVEDGIIVVDFDGNIMKFKKEGGSAGSSAGSAGAAAGSSTSPDAAGTVAANFLDAFASSGSSMGGGSAGFPVTTTIENPSVWYGWMAYSDYYGIDPLDGFYDVWGYVDTADKPYFEIYQDGVPDTAMLSMYMEIENGNIIVPDIGDEDAWFYDTYFSSDAKDDLYGYLMPDGTLVFSFPYDNYSGDYGWTVTLCLRVDGTPWDEANDVLPPRYEEYAAALGGSSGGEATAPEADGEDYGKTTADATGIVDFDTMKAAFDWLRYATGSENGYARPTYEEIREQLGCDAAKAHPDSWEDDYHVYRWETADGVDFLLLSFKVAEDGTETWNSTSWSSNLND